MIKIYRKIFTICVVVFLLTSFLDGQVKYDSLGNYALLFQVQQNLSLSNFSGMVISGKYRISSTSAIRAGIGFLANMQNFNDREQYNPSSGTSDWDLRTRNSRQWMITGKMQYILGLKKAKNINIYLGGGPGLGFSKSTASRDYSDSYGSVDSYSYETSYWFVSLEAIFGAEWYFTRNMSLSAEYNFAYKYSTSKSSTINGTLGDSRDVNYFYSFGGNAVLLGLSVYF